jgi:hypothetical protein
MTVGTEIAPSTAETPLPPVAASPAVWFSILAVAMAGVVPAALMAATPMDGNQSPAWIAALALVVLAGVRFAWLVAQGRMRLFEIVFWLFTYVFLGLAPLSQMRSATYPQTTPNIDTNLFPAAMAVVWVGIAAFIVGLAVATLRRAPADDDRRLALVVPHRLMIFNVVILVVCAYYLAKVGPGSLVLSRVGRSAIEGAAWSNSTIQAIIKAFVSLAPVVGFAAVMRLRHQRRARGEIPPLVWAWVLLVLIVAIDNPISTPRYVTGTAALGVIVALGGASRPRRLRILAVGLVVGMVLVFPLLDMFRYSTDPGQTAPQSFSDTLVTADFDAVDQINNTVSYVRTHGTQHGQQLLGATFFFVPRAIWPTKADDTGVLLADYRGYKVTNLSAPVWTELFIDGTWPLLLLGMGLLGYVLRRSDDATLAGFRVFPAPGVLSATLPFYLIIMLRGSLLQSMAGFTVLVVCSLLVVRRRPVPEARRLLRRSS